MYRERNTERERNWERDRQTDRNWERERERERQTDRQKLRERESERERWGQTKKNSDDAKCSAPPFKVPVNFHSFFNSHYNLLGHAIFFWVSCLSNKPLSYKCVAFISRHFKMILSPNMKRCKIFFLSCTRHSEQWFIVVIVSHFQIWNKKEHNIIISRVISSHIGPIYIKTPYVMNSDVCFNQ